MMARHIDFGKPEVQAFLKRTRARLTWKRVKARIDIAWMTFDLWYSNKMVEQMTGDMGREIALQADLRRKLDAARRIAS